MHFLNANLVRHGPRHQNGQSHPWALNGATWEIQTQPTVQQNKKYRYLFEKPALFQVLKLL